ncbi:MAG: hypothetical protein UR96_C0010G0001, partial [candidate division WS6 bacterium GW2011_GWC1_36_11]
LNDERISLPEYKMFENLVFEIQITTVLYHSFIEQQHDVLYKDSRNLEEINPQQYSYLKDEYKNLIENYMLPAQGWLDYLNEISGKIERKEELFSPKEMELLSSIPDNNVLFDKLTNLKSYMEKYVDLFIKDIDIVLLIKEVILQASKNKIKPLKTQFGTFRGKSFQEVLQISLSIFEILINGYPPKYYARIIEALLDVYIRIPEDKHIIIESLKRIAFPIWEGDKIYFQHSLDFIVIIKSKIGENYEDYIDLITGVSSELLSLDIDKNESINFDSLTIHQSCLPVGKPCKEMRSQVIEYLKKTYIMVSKLDSKLKVIKALDMGTNYPLRGGKDKKLDRLIFENIESILAFYEKELKGNEYSLIQEVETKLLFLSRRSRPEVKLIPNLLNRFERNKEYQMYRLFFGWEYERYDNTKSFKDGDQTRNAKIKKITKEIDTKSLPVWIKRFKEYIHSNSFTLQVSSSNSHEFQNFLRNFAKEKPALAVKVYTKLHNLLDKYAYTYNIILGLFDSSPVTAKKILTKSVNRKSNRYWIAYGIEDFGSLSTKFLSDFFDKLRKTNDISNIVLLIRSLLKKPKLNKGEEHILQIAIKYVSSKHNTSWTRNLYFNEHDDFAIKYLSKETINDILDNLLFAEDLDYHIETILNQISKIYPEELFPFIKNRISKEDSMKEIIPRYSAIPYELFYLDVGTPESVKNFIIDLFKEYKKESLRRWLSTRLISLLLLKIEPEQEISILKLLIDKGEQGSEFALEILEKFDQKPSFTDEIIQYIIKSRVVSKRVKSLIYMIYVHTGVVEGDYGFANYFKETAQRIQEWEKEPALKVFATELSKYLMKKADSEHTSATTERIQREARFKTRS